MSQVTIGELVEDMIPHTEKGNKVMPVEIVPRKIVEDIIRLCENDISIFEKLIEKHLKQNNLTERERQRLLAKREQAYHIMHYAQGKLLEFEEVD